MLAKLLPTLKAHKAELLEAHRTQTPRPPRTCAKHFEERAGILEHDAGLPSAWKQQLQAQAEVVFVGFNYLQRKSVPLIGATSIRPFTEIEDKEGKVATKKGITLRPDLMEELRKAFDAAIERPRA